MECNKDEALRAKEIAERKLNEKDYVAAKKFVLKAQNLYPGLDGLPQMLTTLEVYLSAQNVISSGEVDWYNVLGVSPWADEDTIRKQYRKLALALHPDKNKSLGADGAFKLVSEAWSLISDRDRRVAYNRKLNHRDSRQSKASSTNQPSANGFHHGPSRSSAKATSHKKQNTSSEAPVKKLDTFWTICNQCKTQFEYLRVYHNHTLLCPNCNQAFHAVERAPPPNIMKPSGPNHSQSHHHKHQPKSKPPPPPRNPESSGRGSRVNGAVGGTNASASTGARAGTGTTGTSTVHDWVRNHILKRSGTSVVPPSEEDQSSKRRRSNETFMNPSSHEKTGTADVFAFKVETERIYSFPGNHRRDLTSFEIRNILAGKARLAIREKLEEWSSREAKVSNNGMKKKKNTGNSHNNSKGSGNDEQEPEPVPVPVPELMSINVPDPDFHNFDEDRTERSFKDDQVWAAYDEKDGMPRYYAKIHKVVSLQPFKMKISWINSRTCSEFGTTMDWVGSGFLKTCGDFRTGRHEISNALNAFSHKLKWTKIPRGIIRILPSKGDVWALYKNWSPEWNRDTPKEVVHKYDMVEVLEDYDEERGTSVVPLVKLDGFKTVFSKPDSNAVRRIPREEMLRFSHQVPHHLLTGEEGENAPKGCFDLDPAATPLGLLQEGDEMQEG
ncbi:DnaJ homolog subfamily B member 14 [Linum perenne]